MANAKVCDKCNRFYFYNDLNSCSEPIRGLNMLRFEVTDRNYDSCHKVDLCPDCYRELYKFLTGKEPNECKSESDSKR